MRFKPIGARTLIGYAYLVIIETDEDRRPAGSNAEYMDWYHRGQIIICEVDGQPIEVGTGTKPGHLDCVVEQFDTVYEAINRAYEVGDCGFDHRREGRQKNTWQGKNQPRQKKWRHEA